MDNETCVGQIAGSVQNINYEKLRSAVKAIGFGYAFLYLNLNLGRVNLLPNWVGYLLIREACDDIGEQEPSARLLKPLAALLAVYEGVLWLCKLLELSFSIPAVEVVVAVASLYFHYQLMTNLGDLRIICIFRNATGCMAPAFGRLRSRRCLGFLCSKTFACRPGCLW